MMTVKRAMKTSPLGANARREEQQWRKFVRKRASDVVVVVEDGLGAQAHSPCAHPCDAQTGDRQLI